MKIKMRKLPYEKVMALPRPKHKNPLKPHFLFRVLIRVLSAPALISLRFTSRKEGLEAVGKQPCLILMNHSSFTDLKIVSKLFFPRPFCIVSTTDSYVGKNWLMRFIGCIPTKKFISDLMLIRDMSYALHTLKTSVLMFPEAGYSLDGRATILPKRLGAVIKRLKAPVIMVTTYGAFARDPLYNGLRIRKVKASADVKCLFTAQEVCDKSMDDIDREIEKAFSFDQFAWQRDQRVRIQESFRADGLERVLFKCAACGCEGKMIGKGIHLACTDCGKTYELDEYGQLRALDGKTEFPHIPDWFDWQRMEVEKQIENGEYRLETDVDIGMLVDHKALYMVGSGKLKHDVNGFVLEGCEGKLHYEQSPIQSYSLNVDYYWYEIGDVICIGNNDALYYCFVKGNTSVTRARLAAEALYRMKKQ